MAEKASEKESRLSSLGEEGLQQIKQTVNNFIETLWISASNQHCRVNFNANGGSGSMSSQVFEKGFASKIVLLFNMEKRDFILQSKYQPTGDQPQAIKLLTEGLNDGLRTQVLLGVTGSGKTFTMANVIKNVNRPALVIAHNKTLAAQLYNEFKELYKRSYKRQKGVCKRKG